MSRTSFGKIQREKERRERAAAKAERRAQRTAEPDEPTTSAPAEDEAALLAELADLHERYADGAIDLDTFTAGRDDLTRRLTVG